MIKLSAKASEKQQIKENTIKQGNFIPYKADT